MKTALITGATSGIGAAFARRLAMDGYALVLVARDEQRMKAAAHDLLEVGAANVEALTADLTNAEQRQRVMHRLADSKHPIDLLVNNAGMALGKGLLDSSEAELIDQLELNVTAVMLLTHAALPGMIERRHGAVINIASVAGLVPGRGSTYSASKAWVISFTEGMAMSMQHTGVRMLAVCPGFVRTEFHERAGINMTSTPDALWVDMDTVVTESLDALKANRKLVVPGVLYKGLAAAVKFAPRSLVRSVASRVDRGKRS